MHTTTQLQQQQLLPTTFVVQWTQKRIPQQNETSLHTVQSHICQTISYFLCLLVRWHLHQCWQKLRFSVQASTDRRNLPHALTLTSPLTFFSSKSRSSFCEVQLFTTKNYTVKTSISAENYSGVVGDCWLLKKNLLRTCEQSHCSIVFSRAQRPTCSCRNSNGCCCEPNLIPRINKKSFAKVL